MSTFPHVWTHLVTLTLPVSFSERGRTPTTPENRKHCFHECPASKALLCFFVSFITDSEKSGNHFFFFFCIPPFLFSSQFSGRARRCRVFGPSGSAGKTDHRNPPAGVSCSPVRLLRDPLTVHSLWDNLLVPAPRHGADAWRKTTDTRWRSNEWGDSWIFVDFSFVALLCCSCLRVQESVTIPIFPKSAASSLFVWFFFRGQGSPQSDAELCVLSMGAFWGGCDDVSGPVLILKNYKRF